MTLITLIQHTPSLALSADHSRHAEGEIDTTREIVLAASRAHVRAQPAAHGARQERIEAVGDEGQQDEESAEGEELGGERATRGVGELRQKGQKEERVSSFEDLQSEFLTRVSRLVYANMATTDLHNCPRSRIVHPIWEGSIGWIVSWSATPKNQHLAYNPYASLAYIQDSEKPVYVDCHASWQHNRAKKVRVWNVIKEIPPPMGYDPEPIIGSVDHLHFDLLKLLPWRIELYTLGGEPIIWQPMP